MRNEAPVVLVDMDGVLADFDGRMVEVLLPVIPGVRAERSEFYFRAAYPEWGDEIVALTAEPGFFASLEVMPGALEGWERIKRAGFHPRVCTAPLLRNATCTQDKRAWLTEHFGPEVAAEAIIDGNKAAHAGVALIDDRPTISGSEHAVWQHIMFDASYNRAVEGVPRLDGWADPRLETMLHRARERYDRLLGGESATCWLGRDDPGFRADYPPAFPADG